MFDRIAGVYDRMNTVDDRGPAPPLAPRVRPTSRGVAPGDRALDVATGTGDLALELAGRVAPGGEVIGSDFSERMLELARAKAAARRRRRCRPCGSNLANALALPYGDGEFDAATVGFGARNFSDLGAGCARWRGSCAPAAAS